MLERRVSIKLTTAWPVLTRLDGRGPLHVLTTEAGFEKEAKRRISWGGINYGAWMGESLIARLQPLSLPDDTKKRIALAMAIRKGTGSKLRP